MNKDNTDQSTEQPNYFSIIPAKVRYDKDLTYFTRLLFSEIAALSTKAGYCFANNAYFSEVYDVDKLTVSRAISKLKERGHIRLIYSPDKKRRIYPLVDIPKREPEPESKPELRETIDQKNQ